jgi:hypothetical protein
MSSRTTTWRAIVLLHACFVALTAASAARIALPHAGRRGPALATAADLCCADGTGDIVADDELPLSIPGVPTLLAPVAAVLVPRAQAAVAAPPIPSRLLGFAPKTSPPASPARHA